MEACKEYNMKIKEFSNLTEDDLIAKEKQLKKELFDLESQRQMGRVEKPASFRNLRRDIARILTVLSQKKAPQGTPTGKK